MLTIDDDYPEVLTVIAQTSYDFMVSNQLPQDRAADLAMLLAERIRKEFGGSAPYIPKAEKYLGSKRDREIFDCFDGSNYAVLARQYDLTEMRIRQIVQASRAAEIKRRQSDLF
jgi:Mor family transcriptional regulator